MTEPNAPDLTLEELEELEAKLAAATKQPWKAELYRVHGRQVAEFIYRAEGMRCQIARLMSPTKPDAEAIVALVNAAPQLIQMAKRTAEAERLLGEYKLGVTEQLHYDMKAILTGTPEERSRLRIADLEVKLAEQTKRTSEAERLALVAVHDAPDGTALSALQMATQRIVELERRLSEAEQARDAARFDAAAKHDAGRIMLDELRGWADENEEINATVQECWDIQRKALDTSPTRVPDRCECGGLYVGGVCVRCERAFGDAPPYEPEKS